jgi:RecJ-like exonuclease
VAALEKPVNVARAPAVTVRGGRKPVPIEEEEEEEEEEVEDEDSHENVCNECQETGELYCCSKCRHAYHEDSLSYWLE